MRSIIFLLIGCAFFTSCEKTTQIQILNNRVDEKIIYYGLGDYYSDTGRIRNVEHRYIEYGEMTDILVRMLKYSYDEMQQYDIVDEIFIYKIAANSTSNVIEIKRCDKIEIIYTINGYNNYYLNSNKITERVLFDKVEFYDNIKYGKINKITIKD